MKLFHWDDVEVLENYSAGHIIVMAESVELARGQALVDFIAYAKGDNTSRWSYLFEPDGSIRDPDDAETWREALAELDRDLAKEPLVYDGPHAIIIRGSE